MSDINYTTEGENERETGSGPAREVAGKRGPTPKFSVLLFHRVRQRVAGGEAVGRAIRASGIGASRFYECVAAQPRLAVDLQYAREHKLPAHRSTRAAGRSESDRRVKAWSAKDLQPGEVRHLSVRMLMLLLKLLAPRKYGMASPCGKDAEKRRPGDTASKVPPRSKAPPCTQSASGGEAVGERAEVRGQRSEETPESPCDFVAEDAGGKVVMARKCPEIGRDVGSRGGGVKAVEGSTLFTEFDGVTAGAFLDLDLAHDLDRAEHPESGTKRHPVVCRRPVLKAVEGYRSPSPGGAPERLAVNGHSWGIRRWAIEAGGGGRGNVED